MLFTVKARTYLQIPLWQWGAGNVYLLVLSSWKVNVAENPIAVMGLYIRSGYESRRVNTRNFMIYVSQATFI